ncbi:Bet v I domain [Macleaya cordata]|uniref:Bet v I domain n=1 Tax=Macleaya cordata TaxID=56857 RepID=A0A200Q0V7_MACCD|nr:Bet v I domain [Macleaya cordata]
MAAAANNIQKLEVEIEVNCSADKFYGMFKHDVQELPKHLPHLYEGVEVLEGDGIGVGSVKRWHYVLHEGGRCLNGQERMTVVDDEKRLITHRVFEGEVMNDYKFLDIKLAVTPKEGGDGHGSVVKWTVEYEKANEDAPVPTAYIEFVKRVTRDLNAHLHKHA